jgi:prepilin-type N-terminal cleavage/methylation domain-containing protein
MSVPLQNDHLMQLPGGFAEHGRRGFTLIEMLVAMTASMLLLAAVMTIFETLSQAVGNARRLGSLDSQLCTVSTLLRKDLAGVTAYTDENGLGVATTFQTGYFEIIEGPDNDSTAYLSNPRTGLVGDCDDILFFTTMPVTNEHFSGKFGTDVITSDVAEVAYFCRPTPGTSDPPLYTLYRRVALVYGVNPLPPFDANASLPSTPWDSFYQQYDLSVRRNASKFLLNSIENLADRVNRLSHNPDDVPPSGNAAAAIQPLAGSRIGEDMLLTNVVAFDIRVLDPTVTLRLVNGFQLQPGDIGYGLTAQAIIPDQAAYVDLGYSGGVDSTFSGYGTGPLEADDDDPYRTYDTWNHASLEQPPYAASLKAVQITLRVYDATARRVRQLTVAHSFGN